MVKPYYFIKAYSGTTAYGQEVYEHCYFQTVEEAKNFEAECKAAGRKTTDIEEVR